MEKLTTFKHTKDGMLTTENNDNPYVQVKEVKMALTDAIDEYRRRQSCWGPETDAYKEYDNIIEAIDTLYTEMFN